MERHLDNSWYQHLSVALAFGHGNRLSYQA